MVQCALWVILLSRHGNYGCYNIDADSWLVAADDSIPTSEPTASSPTNIDMKDEMDVDVLKRKVRHAFLLSPLFSSFLFGGL